MSDRPGTAFVLRPGEGRSIDLGNFVMSVKAAGDETGGAFALLEAAEPPDFGPPLHIHGNTAEAFYVLEGEYHIFIDEQAYACQAGSFIFIPAGIRHGFRVGAAPSRKLNLYTPAAMVGYFDELGAAIQGGDADPHRLDEIARRHGMEVTGSVPEGYL
jgi:mannose-6-phosphate isomerase-like protein (cupin superfamily)